MPRHRFHSKKITKDAAGIKHGYRSGLEASIRQQLEEAGIEPNYEGLHLKYTVPETKHIYSPDFPVGKHIIIETKGLFKLEDRKKMLLLKEQYPELDFRFIFHNANQRTDKRYSTTYRDWCEKHGFKWAHKQIPLEWLREIYDDQA